MSKYNFYKNDIYNKYYEHITYNINYLNATMSTVKDYCDCGEEK